MNGEKKPQACLIAYGFYGFVDVDLDVIVISIPSFHIPNYQGIPAPHRLYVSSAPDEQYVHCSSTNYHQFDDKSWFLTSCLYERENLHL
ncbi:hypothetical protein [Scytonema sp. PRP1]|uniref:hypothetical protein n=1 Tax=Scytonema sp. PRP1 TaxID=3120513 RepID=UPI00300CDD16